ncbi:pyridoxamine 5'-phosphate oxidase family protein [Thioalkalivibrio sp.]|uniref:pyridoxamine 5'-phosphate oxidase family protein n=1 Tax=Thioalkalivibrio sp. TaxID=2093813 RepID=UPI0025F0653A|nr:pyridoxamine 5'-phosphate oxidase family protein [Thioalkalivibrio sp.]
MNRDYDEPKFVDVVSTKNNGAETEILDEIKGLCKDQPFAVLATQGEGQPYVSLISFAISEDLRQIVFSTPSQTRKFTLISSNDKVSLMIDNRSQQPESINLICGLTITGHARVLDDPKEIEEWGRALTAKHGYLQKFVDSNTSNLILVETTRFFYVRRFQEVYQWAPGSNAASP